MIFWGNEFEEEEEEEEEERKLLMWWIFYSVSQFDCKLSN
jgi:hypothetical protein